MKSFLILILFSTPLVAGEIVRDPSQVRAFKRVNPCPATSKIEKSCPGYVVDHIVPLCAGGADRPSNMQWQDKIAGLQKDKLEWWLCRRIKQC
ncbi:MAG: HNHc protein [Podoviridae sp. ctQNx1]|nr:MAG: HNHc protein [Podoviridae sp. ctQNx1]UOF78096.1 hnhc [Caudoviricetes sp.]